MLYVGVLSVHGYFNILSCLIKYINIINFSEEWKEPSKMKLVIYRLKENK